MKNNNKSKESSYIRYLDANNLYGCLELYQYVGLNGLKIY